MPAKPKLAKKEVTNDVTQRIAQRAYELYEMRGHEIGHDLAQSGRGNHAGRFQVIRLDELKWLRPNRKQLAVLALVLFLSLLCRCPFR